MNPSPQELSRIRHELRSPINQIIGYCELLLEDESLPAAFTPDLNRILSGGRQLLEVLTEYFDASHFEERRRNVFQLHHDLRTPVNHIIGYTELLEELVAENAGTSAQLAQDLGRIRAAAHHWLALMEEYLISSSTEGSVDGEFLLASPAVTLNTGSPRSAIAANHHGEGRILVVDDAAANREILVRRLVRHGYSMTAVDNGMDALRRLRTEPFDLVLLDLLMPGIDGYQVLVKLKTDAKLRHIPVLMVSGLDQDNGIARCIEAGADDYLTKPFNPVLLRARIGACLEKKRLRDRERETHQALIDSQRLMAAELAGAAEYVRSRLPGPLTGEVTTSWCFEPSEQLGGDAFGYHWLEGRQLAVYLLDVSGHGISAALLSVSILNLLRSDSLARVDFRRPAEVLLELNRAFPMEAHNNLYFTLWYGVIDLANRNLRYSTAGHPPAFLWTPGTPDAPVHRLRTRGAPIGCLPEARYEELEVTVPIGARLLVLSDGAYEVCTADGRSATLEDFAQWLDRERRVSSVTPDSVLKAAQRGNGGRPLEDDVSVVVIDVP